MLLLDNLLILKEGLMTRNKQQPYFCIYVGFRSHAVAPKAKTNMCETEKSTIWMVLAQSLRWARTNEQTLSKWLMIAAQNRIEQSNQPCADSKQTDGNLSAGWPFPARQSQTDGDHDLWLLSCANYLLPRIIKKDPSLICVLVSYPPWFPACQRAWQQPWNDQRFSLR